LYLQNEGVSRHETLQLSLLLFSLQHIKRPALQNKQVVVLRVAFRARKVIGTFEKRAPGLWPLRQHQFWFSREIGGFSRSPCQRWVGSIFESFFYLTYTEYYIHQVRMILQYCLAKDRRRRENKFDNMFLRCRVYSNHFYFGGARRAIGLGCWISRWSPAFKSRSGHPSGFVPP